MTVLPPVTNLRASHVSVCNRWSFFGNVLDLTYTSGAASCYGRFLNSPKTGAGPLGDPWSRPTVDDLRRVLESIDVSDENHNRSVDRLELSVPAEVTTGRGNTIAAMTREISRFGVGLLHRGAITPGDVRIKLASDTREFEYRVRIEWGHPCDGGMFMSGGRFLAKEN